ncbi:hypothetical protein FLA_0485 [Filimonas lacunae]|nr:hypothetical protein FLA_0485 [Filimonas lacunae]
MVAEDIFSRAFTLPVYSPLTFAHVLSFYNLLKDSWFNMLWG